MSKELIAQSCKYCPEEVRQDLQSVRRPLQAGLRLEDLPSMLERPSVRHTNGARAISTSERAYQGGPSAADRMDS